MSKLIPIVVILILGLVLVGLTRQINDALQASNRLDQAAAEVTGLQSKNQQLKKKLTEVQQPNFIEQIARNKLNFARPNETVVIIPKEALDKVVLGASKKIEDFKLPNWEGWLRLFFK